MSVDDLKQKLFHEIFCNDATTISKTKSTKLFLLLKNHQNFFDPNVKFVSIIDMYKSILESPSYAFLRKKSGFIIYANYNHSANGLSEIAKRFIQMLRKLYKTLD